MRAFDFAVRRPWLVLASFAVVTVIALFGIGRLQQEEDLLTFLPTQNPDVRLFRDVSHRFGGLRVALIGVEVPEGKDVFSADVLKKISDATTAVTNTTGVDRAMSIAVIPEITSGPTGAELRPLIPALPTNDAEQKALRAKVLGNEAIAGALVSRDGRAALVMAFLADGVADRTVTADLRAAARRTLAPLPVYFGGAPFAGQAIYQEAQNDVWWLSPLALLVLLIAVVLSFRDPLGVVLTVISVGWTVAVIMGGMGLVGEKFTVATSTLPVILFASGSSYSVNVLGRYYLLRSRLGSLDAMRESLSRTGPALLIAAAAAAVGFFSFVATDVQPLRGFGIACAMGVLLCWFNSMTLLPAVVAVWPRKAAREVELDRLGEAMLAVWYWARQRRGIVVLTALAVLAAGIVPMQKVKVRMEPRAFFRQGSEPAEAERFLEERFGGAHFLQVAAQGNFDDPATLRELQRMEDFARSLPAVTQINSILGPLKMVSEAMGGGYRLPTTPAQATNLYFFLDGQPGMSALITTSRREVLLSMRLRGDASAAVAALEAWHPPSDPALPGVRQIGERVLWTMRANGHAADADQIDRAVRGLALPAESDAAWAARRAEAVRAFFDSAEAPPLAADVQARVLAAFQTGDTAGLNELATVAGEDGTLARQLLAGQLFEARRDIAIDRGLPTVLAAGGVSALPDGAPERRQLRVVLDDLFLSDAAKAVPASKTPFKIQVAGEPILDRGFSRSVEQNQVRSLLVALGAVFVLLTVLFRSAHLAFVCMAPSMVTLVGLFGIMGACGVNIDLGTSLIAGITTGAGSDFALQYVYYLRREPIDRVTRGIGPIMFLSVVLIAIGFGVLAFGRSPVMRLFGSLAGASMLVAALWSCLLLPALLPASFTDRNRPA
jgi:predicted RND superfamily exporter protein